MGGWGKGTQRKIPTFPDYLSHIYEWMVRASKRTFLKEKMGTGIHFPNLVARVPIAHRVAFSITAVAVGNSSLYPPSCPSYLLCLLPVATTAEESDDPFPLHDQSLAEQALVAMKEVEPGQRSHELAPFAACNSCQNYRACSASSQGQHSHRWNCQGIL